MVQTLGEQDERKSYRTILRANMAREQGYSCKNKGLGHMTPLCQR